MDREETGEAIMTGQEEKQSILLWQGILSEHTIELGPSGSFAIDGRLELTCWSKASEMKFTSHCGKRVRIFLEMGDDDQER